MGKFKSSAANMAAANLSVFSGKPYLPKAESAKKVDAVYLGDWLKHNLGSKWSAKVESITLVENNDFDTPFLEIVVEDIKGNEIRVGRLSSLWTNDEENTPEDGDDLMDMVDVIVGCTHTRYGSKDSFRYCLEDQLENYFNELDDEDEDEEEDEPEEAPAPKKKTAKKK